MLVLWNMIFYKCIFMTSLKFSIYCEMYFTSRLFVLFVFALNTTSVGESLLGYDHDAR